MSSLRAMLKAWGIDPLLLLLVLVVIGFVALAILAPSLFRYVMRRLAWAIPTLFTLLLISFILIRVTPGGPFDTEGNRSAEVTQNLESYYHLDEPMLVQFGYYLNNLANGDLGYSMKYTDLTINEMLAMGAADTVLLGTCALILALIVGVFIGAIAALRQNSWLDYALMGTAMIGVSLPNFVVGPLLIVLFGFVLQLLPMTYGGGIDSLIMPVITLALPQIAYIARLTRGSMVEVLQSNYVRTAYAKGLPARVVLFRHALKPSLLPVVSYLGPTIAGVLTGSFVVEKIFNVPGIGSYFIDGAINRDYTLVMGVVVLYGVLIVFLNLIADLLYAWLDPKVRKEYE